MPGLAALTALVASRMNRPGLVLAAAGLVAVSSLNLAAEARQRARVTGRLERLVVPLREHADLPVIFERHKRAAEAAAYDARGEFFPDAAARRYAVLDAALLPPEHVGRRLQSDARMQAGYEAAYGADAALVRVPPPGPSETFVFVGEDSLDAAAAFPHHDVRPLDGPVRLLTPRPAGE